MSESNAPRPLGAPPVMETHPMMTPQHVANLMHNNIAFLWNKTRGAPWRDAALGQQPDGEENTVRAAHLHDKSLSFPR